MKFFDLEKENIKTKNSKHYEQYETCLVDKFYARESEKPVHLRSKYCMISCPCKKCSPIIL